MPYITQEKRMDYDCRINGLFSPALPKMDAGSANYCITRIIWKFMHQDGKPRYIGFCIAMGTLICVMLELYRRKAAPYEDEKIKENGDVYGD